MPVLRCYVRSLEKGQARMLVLRCYVRSLEKGQARVLVLRVNP
jgi:hypothetical protein